MILRTILPTIGPTILDPVGDADFASTLGGGLPPDAVLYPESNVGMAFPGTDTIVEFPQP